MKILEDLVLLFLLAIAVNLICSRFRILPMVGFLITGVICGPSALGLVNDQETIDHVAELGVAMLLFTIGMELSGDALNRLKRPVFLGGSLQIGLTVAAIALLSVGLMHASLPAGIFWGCLAALSSSAIVLQIFQKKAVTSTPVGRLALAILVFQDIMVAPLMIAVPLLGGAVSLSLSEGAVAAARVAGVLGGVLLLARFGLDRLMDAVMRTRAREILLLTTLALCLGMACLTQKLGLSFSLGAFLAGLLLARSPYSMSVVSGVLPYRDVFLSLFFVSVGMVLDVQYFAGHAPLILGAAAVFIAVKFLLCLPAVLMQGYPLHTAIVCGLSLAQVGEFAFVLAVSGLELGLFSKDQHQLFLALSVITMMLTPLLIDLAPKLADRVARRPHAVKPSPDAEEDGTEDAPAGGRDGHEGLDNHLIIVGFGISGRHLAMVARESGIPYVILEMNPETVRRCRTEEPIMHGDASQPLVLEHLGVHTARVMAIVISDPAAVRAITEQARAMNPNLHIVARTRFVTEISPLRLLGADVVVSEEFESSIEVFGQVLSHYLIPRQDIEAFSVRLRQDNYRMIRHPGEGVGDIRETLGRMPEMGVQVLRLAEGAPLCGVRLMESGLRGTHGMTLMAVRRGENMIASPGPDFELRAGDLLHIFAPAENFPPARPLFDAPAEPRSA